MSTFSQEKGMAAHSSILAWRIPTDKGAWQATVHRVARVRHDWATKHTHTHTHTHIHTLFLNADTGSGNGRNLPLAVWGKMQKVGLCSYRYFTSWVWELLIPSGRGRMAYNLFFLLMSQAPLGVLCTRIDTIIGVLSWSLISLLLTVELG